MRRPMFREFALRLGLGTLLLLPLAPAIAQADWPTSPTVNLPICTATDLQTTPALAPDLLGGFYIAWQDRRTNVDTDIYAMHVLASGITDPTWPLNGKVICAVTGNQSLPKLAPDGAGGAFIAWNDIRSGSTDIYLHHVVAGGSLDPLYPPTGLPVCTMTGSQTLVAFNTSLVSDQQGGVLLAWRDNRNDSDLYVGHVLGSGQLDPAWPATGLAIASGPGAQFGAQVCADGQGGLFASWQDARSGPDYDIYVQHVRADGTTAPGWTANGTPICTASGVQQASSIAADGHGGIFVTWEDRRGASTDVYTQHVLATGAVDPAWPADGRATCAAPGNQTAPRVIGGELGSAFVVWTDSRAGSIPSLYAQHLLANGTLDPTWPATDLNFCAVFANHINLVVVSDGAGGALAVWDDNRSGLSVYAHHLTSQGVDPSWPVNGLGVSTAAQGQNAGGAVVPDGSGGLVVTWSDSRSGGPNPNDIYAQRVKANGTLGGSVLDVPLPTAAGLSLAPLRPTPSRHQRLGLRFTLAQPAEVSVELFDVAGRRQASESLGTFAAGHHAFEWAPSTRLAPGLHFVRLRAGDEVRTIRAVLME